MAGVNLKAIVNLKTIWPLCLTASDRPGLKSGRLEVFLKGITIG